MDWILSSLFISIVSTEDDKWNSVQNQSLNVKLTFISEVDSATFAWLIRQNKNSSFEFVSAEDETVCKFVSNEDETALNNINFFSEVN